MELFFWSKNMSSVLKFGCQEKTNDDFVRRTELNLKIIVIESIFLTLKSLFRLNSEKALRFFLKTWPRNNCIKIIITQTRQEFSTKIKFDVRWSFRGILETFENWVERANWLSLLFRAPVRIFRRALDQITPRLFSKFQEICLDSLSLNAHKG